MSIWSQPTSRGRNNTRPARSQTRAFTLIELLVVIGIIGILIAILLPALIRARQVAKDLACGSNVRQIATALLIYATESHGYLPAAEGATTGDERAFGPTVTWHVRIWQRVLGRPFPTNDYTGNGVYDYLTSTVFECPCADQSRIGGYSQTDHRQNGYGLNINMPGSAAPKSMADVDSKRRIAENKDTKKARDPSRTMLLIDAKGFYVEYFSRHSSLIDMDAGISNEGGVWMAQGRHSKTKDSWNVAFLDGSVRLMKYKEIPATPVQYYNSAGLLSPNQLMTQQDIPYVTKMFWVGQAR